MKRLNALPWILMYVGVNIYPKKSTLGFGLFWNCLSPKGQASGFLFTPACMYYQSSLCTDPDRGECRASIKTSIVHFQLVLLSPLYCYVPSELILFKVRQRSRHNWMYCRPHFPDCSTHLPPTHCYDSIYHIILCIIYHCHFTDWSTHVPPTHCSFLEINVRQGIFRTCALYIWIFGYWLTVIYSKKKHSKISAQAAHLLENFSVLEYAERVFH